MQNPVFCVTPKGWSPALFGAELAARLVHGRLVPPEACRVSAASALPLLARSTDFSRTWTLVSTCYYRGLWLLCFFFFEHPLSGSGLIR